MADVIDASGENDLWDILERLLSDPSPEPGSVLRLRSWQPRLLYFPDEPIGHTVTPSMARALVEFHASVSRAYAYLVYGQARGRLLHSDDMSILDFRSLVTAGSDGIEIIAEDVGRLASGIISKMTGRQITLSVVLFLLLSFSSTIAREFLHEHYESKRRESEAHERADMSAQETARIRLLTEAFRVYQRLRPLASITDDGKESRY